MNRKEALQAACLFLQAVAEKTEKIPTLVKYEWQKDKYLVQVYHPADMVLALQSASFKPKVSIIAEGTPSASFTMSFEFPFEDQTTNAIPASADGLVESFEYYPEPNITEYPAGLEPTNANEKTE